jgi:hypothetical protein
MKQARPVRTLTARIPELVYEGLAQTARERQVSMNTLVGDVLAALVRDAEQERLASAFDLLGQDAEGCDMEWAVPAQSEVMLRDNINRLGP